MHYGERAKQVWTFNDMKWHQTRKVSASRPIRSLEIGFSQFKGNLSTNDMAGNWFFSILGAMDNNDNNASMDKNIS